VVYHKMWLGGAESERFTPGDKPVVLEVDGWRLGLAICKDTGIAQHASDTAALGIHAYLAGVLEFAQDAAVQDERARRVATDHQLWWPWPASPARPEAATPGLRAVPVSGALMAS
jgi:predicted amidohydrolase